MNPLRPLLLVCLGLSSLPAHASLPSQRIPVAVAELPSPVAPNPIEAGSLLARESFDALDRRYGGIQRSYADGEISEIELRAAFRTFYDTDRSLEPRFAAWVIHSPNSYVAHLARGIYHDFVSHGYRDGPCGDFASEKQRADWHRHGLIASREFAKSLALEKKPILTYLYSMDFEMEHTGVLKTRELLDKAIEIDPKTFIVRQAYMGVLRSGCSGSTRQMKDFLEETRAVGLNRSQIEWFENLIQRDKVNFGEFRKKDPERAALVEKRIARFSQGGACAGCSPLMDAGDVAMAHGRFKDAVESYTKILNIHENEVDALVHRGDSWMQLREPGRAEPDFLRAANLGNAYAQRMLGAMYWGDAPGVQSVVTDRKQAIAWMTKAAAQGDETATAMLRQMTGKREHLPGPSQ